MTSIPAELLSSSAGLCVAGFLLSSILLKCSASGWLHPNRSLMCLWLWSDPQMVGQLSAHLHLSSGLATNAELLGTRCSVEQFDRTLPVNSLVSDVTTSAELGSEAVLS